MNKKKLLITLSIAIIGLFIIALVMFSCDKTTVNDGDDEILVTGNNVTTDEETPIVDDEITVIEEQIYAMPKSLAFRASTMAAAIRKGQTVDVKIQASVSPYNATHPEVDFSVAWGNAPTHGSEPVTDYVTVKQDADGSTKATISCKKSFDDDKIIVTVTTRDGGFTDNCTVTFIGIADDLEITSDEAYLTYSEARGMYYEIGTKRTTTFNINLDNIFHDVGVKNISVKFGGSGSLYYGTFVDSYDAFSWSFTNMHKISMSELASSLMGYSINGNVLSITVFNNDVESYTSGDAEGEYSTHYTYDKFVYDDLCYASGEWLENAHYNEQNIDKCYFTITVTDTVSGESDTINVWIVTSVTGVDINEDDITI